MKYHTVVQCDDTLEIFTFDAISDKAAKAKMKDFARLLNAVDRVEDREPRVRMNFLIKGGEILDSN